MQHEKTNWQNLPSNDTPINANNLNNIEDTLYDLTREETITVTANAPWLGDITLKRKGNRVEMSAELTGGDPWEFENAILFTVPDGWRPRAFVLLSAYTGGASIPLQYYEDETHNVFYLNVKLATKPANSTDIIFNTFYFID